MSRFPSGFFRRSTALLGALVALMCGALADPARAQSVTAAPANAALDAARAAFEALPIADRKAIQDALVWTGDYTGTVDGTFGRITFESIAKWQARLKLPPNGILDDKARATLALAAQGARSTAKFQMVTDDRSGVRIGLPMRWVDTTQKSERGTRWSSRDGRALFMVERVETASDAELGALYEQMKAEQPGRKVGYAVLRADWFVITAETSNRRSYIRFARGSGELRGFTVSYDKAAGPELDRLALAVANSFDPFPAAGGQQAAAAQTSPASPGSATSPGNATAAGGTTPAQPAPPVDTGRDGGSGLVVGASKLLTAARLVKTCKAVTVAGRPARVLAADDTTGLALIETDAAKGAGAALALAPPAPATPILALAYVEPNAPAGLVGAGQLMAAAGETVGAPDGASAKLRIVAPLQRGGLGATVLDRSGAVVGLVLGQPTEKRLVAGIVPEAAYAVASGAEIAAVLAAAGMAPATAGQKPGQTAGALVDAMRGSVLPVVCTR